jgi:hypothetical protein
MRYTAGTMALQALREEPGSPFFSDVVPDAIALLLR